MTTQASGNHQGQRDLRASLTELEHRARCFEYVLDSLPQGVRIVDHDLTVIYANRAAREHGGTSVSEANSKCYLALRQGEPCEDCPVVERGASADHLYAMLCQASSEGRPVDGEPVCALLTAVPASPGARSRGEPSPITVEMSGAAGGDSLGSLIGRSVPMRHLFEMIRLVAPSDATVLLEGESGTGKEMVARTIHGLSRRGDHRFVVIDCGALPETLLESELFGHVRGAFTGAVATKPGLFEEAESGTIFLDEIADTSSVFQTKLLRAIQEGEIKPVGGNRRIKINVRVIAASNKALIPLVAAKAFREDLYYRLAVIPIAVPSLRQRREDIPLLVEAFVTEMCARYGRNLLAVPPEALRLLTNHAWPGNVRELRHVIERAILTATGSELAADRLFTDLVGTHTPARLESSLRSEMHDAMRLLERARIVEALNHAKGNRARAARLLKISRATFYNKLRDYQIPPSERCSSAAPMRPIEEKTV